jgi:hypothetical protein
MRVVWVIGGWSGSTSEGVLVYLRVVSKNSKIWRSMNVVLTSSKKPFVYTFSASRMASNYRLILLHY